MVQFASLFLLSLVVELLSRSAWAQTTAAPTPRPTLGPTIAVPLTDGASYPATFTTCLLRQTTTTLGFSTTTGLPPGVECWQIEARPTGTGTQFVQKPLFTVPPKPSAHDDTNAPAIAGGVIGGVLILTGCVLAFVYRQKRKNVEKTQSSKAQGWVNRTWMTDRTRDLERDNPRESIAMDRR